MRAIGILAAGLAFGVATVMAASGQEKRVSAGKQSYQSYCATCHGPSGGGDGVLAGSLRKRPPNLTQLAKQAAGTFPEDKVFKAIEGSGRAASSDMPVWRDVFGKMQGNPSAEEITLRISALVDYLESIQDKP
jgi:mono/diheme cytochrome c family protein